MQQPKAKVGDLILTTSGEIIGFSDQGFENQLCVVKRISDRMPGSSNSRRFSYFATTLADGREVELFGDEFEVAPLEEGANT